MNKEELISKVASGVGLSKTDAAKSVDAVFSNITSSLKSGNEVRIVGFGTFLVANRAATTGRNPRTGESIQIPAKKVPKFRAGKALKNTVNWFKFNKFLEIKNLEKKTGEITKVFFFHFFIFFNILKLELA